MASFREGHDPELPMALALHTSETFLANCPEFRVFDCDSYPEECVKMPLRHTHLDYPLFSNEGMMI
jgi:hypothetical protein